MDQNEYDLTPDDLWRAICPTIGEVLRSIPDCSMRPTDISRRLDISRVMVSRTLSAIDKESPVETLTKIPGPETLRSMMRACESLGVSKACVSSALEAIDLFDHLIRSVYGTRAALNAALSVENNEAKDKFEHSSRYQVFKGMSQTIGVESRVWLTSTMFAYSSKKKDHIELTSIFGPSGIRRLRPDTPFDLVIAAGPERMTGRDANGKTFYDIGSMCPNEPAPVSLVDQGDQQIKTLSPDIGGKEMIYDMLSAVHIPEAMTVIPKPNLSRRGISVIPAIPVAVLNIDVLLQKDILEGIEPEAFTYIPRGNVKSTFADVNWNINRIKTNDEVISLGRGLSKLELADIPRYAEMVEHLCKQRGYNPDEFRAYRYQIQYPVFGFQYILGFGIPGRHHIE
ncbi:MAG: hypothetical protein JKX70_09705 [Phycisphaerales bacterium]|nr:hypothetical protein [Phycisphaerales bacterium]